MPDALNLPLTLQNAANSSDPTKLIAFATTLYEANNFRFDQLVPWLRQYVTLPGNHPL
jgi:hypothetical protein